MLRLSIFFIVILCSIVFVCSSFAAAFQHHLHPAKTRKVHPRLHNYIKDAKFSSVDDIFTSQNFSGIARFRWPGKNVSYNKNFGYLDTRFKIPLPEDPTFPIASNTKLYVAVSLYQLHEAGKIKSMDDNVADYLTPQDFANMGLPGVQKYCPTLQNDTTCQRVTFTHLLGMSSGIQNQNYQWLPFPGSLAQVAGMHLQAPLLFVPGSPSPQNSSFANYYYSNAGFEFSAYFVEKLSGMSFNDYIQQHICRPAGLKNTYFDPFNGKFHLNPNRVNEYYHFYDLDNASNQLGFGKVSSEYDLGSASGAGGILSTPNDEDRLYRHLFSNFSASYNPASEGKIAIISQSSLLKLVTPYSFIQDDFFYGQGLFVIAIQESSNQPTDHGNGRIPKTNPPTVVVCYEGEIMGSRTSNFFDTRYDPPVMGQVWSSNIAFYPTKQQFEAVKTSRGQNFWQLTGNWPQQTSLQTLSISMIQALAGMPPRN